MELYVLFGQWKPGDDIEAIAVADETTHEASPDFLHEMFADNQAEGEFDALAIVPIEVDRDAVMQWLYPDGPLVIGVVSKPKGEL